MDYIALKHLEFRMFRTTLCRRGLIPLIISDAAAQLRPKREAYNLVSKRFGGGGGRPGGRPSKWGLSLYLKLTKYMLNLI